MPKKTWFGTIPTKCDICHTPIQDIFIDGRTTYGPWAILCPLCHSEIGAGLGVGRGQEYTLNPATKEWVKTGG